MRDTVDVRPSYENGIVNVERWPIRRAFPFDNFTFRVQTHQLRFTSLFERRVRIEQPNRIRCSRVSSADVPVTKVSPTEFSEELIAERNLFFKLVLVRL